MSAWERRIGPGAVPVVVAGMHRVFWVPARYRSVAAIALDGRRFTVRELAERTGYSVMGAHHALRMMARLGIGLLTTARGKRGWTRFRVKGDVSVKSNVRTTVTASKDGSLSRYVSTVSVVRTLGPEPSNEAGEAGPYRFENGRLVYQGA